MTPGRIFIILITGIVLQISGCNIEPSLDKSKFAELHRASRDLQAAFSIGDHCQVPNEILQRLSSGTAAVKEKTTSQAERDLLAAFENLAIMSRDALHLCKSRGQLTGFQFVPKGRIYVSQDLDPIVERYDLATESHVYKATGARWRSISSDAIQVIREKAEALIRNIEVILKYS